MLRHENGSIKGSVLGNSVNCHMIRWMRRRFHRKKIPFIVVEPKMAENDQDLSQEQMDKLEADLKESLDQLKETVFEEVEKKADDKK